MRDEVKNKGLCILIHPSSLRPHPFDDAFAVHLDRQDQRCASARAG